LLLINATITFLLLHITSRKGIEKTAAAQ